MCNSDWCWKALPTSTSSYPSEEAIPNHRGRHHGATSDGAGKPVRDRLPRLSDEVAASMIRESRPSTFV